MAETNFSLFLKHPTQEKTIRQRHSQVNRMPNKCLYCGVHMRKWGKWVSEIREPLTSSRICLGTFDTPKMAVRARDAAMLCLRGKKGYFKFPDSLPNLSSPPPSSAKDIQKQAADAAAASRPVHIAKRPVLTTSGNRSTSVQLQVEYKQAEASAVEVCSLCLQPKEKRLALPGETIP
eukprot:c43063_g1_i1 orf=252-782(+)